MKSIIKEIKGLKRSTIIKYLLYVLMVTLAFTTTSLARYTSSESVNALAEVAIFAAGSNTYSIDFPAAGMTPGSTADIEFSITNFNGNSESEVALNYNINVKTTGNLPLTFKLTPVSIPASERSKAVGDFDSGTNSASGGQLPLGSTTHMTHKYKLTVMWPQSENDEKYIDEIDMISVFVQAEQAGAK